MREIKFKYGYSDGISTFEKAFTLEEIEQGLQFEEISDSPLLKNYKIVYKRQYTGLKDAINKNDIYIKEKLFNPTCENCKNASPYLGTSRKWCEASIKQDGMTTVEKDFYCNRWESK